MNDSQLKKMYQTIHTIATVGFSTNPEKAGYSIPMYLMSVGYKVIPVNPTVREIAGQKAYPDLLSIPEKVDVVQIFRPPEEVPPIVDQAIQIGAKIVWMQPGAENPQAARKAQEAGLTAEMGRCLGVEHQRLFG